MEKEPVAGGLEKKLLEHISHNVEQEGGQRVTLAKATAALDPSTRNPVEEDCSLASLVQHTDPGPPAIGESFG
jgi:hypothetical protein